MTHLRLAVCNPGGKDAFQSFAAGPGAPSESGHAPVNMHAFAAATHGTFVRTVAEIPDDAAGVLLLLRGNLRAATKALAVLRATRPTLRVAVTFKETGLHQLASTLQNASVYTRFRELCAGADFALATTYAALPIYHGAGARASHFVPTPYPIHAAEWDFSVPFAEREGVAIGTREFAVPSRNHLAALLALRPFVLRTGTRLHVVNTEGRNGRRLLAALGYPESLLVVREGRVSYPLYLRWLAARRAVFQLDSSSVPGQVAGDSLLCRVPCLGGNGTTETLATPAFSMGGVATPELLAALKGVVLDAPSSALHISTALARAELLLGFSAVAKNLAALFLQC